MMEEPDAITSRKYNVKGGTSLSILRNSQIGWGRPAVLDQTAGHRRYIEMWEVLSERNTVLVLRQPLIKRL